MYLYRMLYLLLAISLSACGDTTPETSTEAPAVTEQGTPANPPEATAAEPEAHSIAPSQLEAELPPALASRDTWKGDLDALEDKRVIRVLTVYSPGRYYLDNGEEKGLTREMATRLEEFINKRFGRKHVKVHVVVIPLARNQLVPALLEGRGDIIMASLSITDERDAILDFTSPVSKPLSEILVTGPAAPALDSIEDLSGQTIFVRQSSSYRESVEQLNERLQAAGKAPVEIQLVSELLEDDDLIEMVNSGLLPWVIVDDYKLQLWDDVFDKLVIRDDIVFRSGGRIAWAIRENSPKLESALNEFLKKNREGTLVGNVLRNRYIRDFDWAANALDNEDYGRFEALENIFRKYGKQYGIDYLMVAAQGYQESRLDQNARSNAGAVGVMQLLPSTASDKNVAIDDIHQVENNIHAGVKYLSYLRNRYFNDPAITPDNQTLLALATYNAGPRRMINLRNEAEKLGYDPNVWFDNVELVAAKRIGRETVQYVANIFKYQLAYRLTAEQQLRHQAARERAGIND